MLLWGKLETTAIIVSLDLVLWPPYLSKAYPPINLTLWVTACDTLTC